MSISWQSIKEFEDIKLERGQDSAKGIIKITINPTINYNLEGINESKLAEDLENLELHSLLKQVSTFKALFSKEGLSEKDNNQSSIGNKTIKNNKAQRPMGMDY